MEGPPGESQPQARAPIPGSSHLEHVCATSERVLTLVVETCLPCWAEGWCPVGAPRQVEGEPSSPFQPRPGAQRKPLPCRLRLLVKEAWGEPWGCRALDPRETGRGGGVQGGLVGNSVKPRRGYKTKAPEPEPSVAAPSGRRKRKAGSGERGVRAAGHGWAADGLSLAPHGNVCGSGGSRGPRLLAGVHGAPAAPPGPEPTGEAVLPPGHGCPSSCCPGRLVRGLRGSPRPSPRSPVAPSVYFRSSGTRKLTGGRPPRGAGISTCLPCVAYSAPSTIVSVPLPPSSHGEQGGGLWDTLPRDGGPRGPLRTCARRGAGRPALAGVCPPSPPPPNREPVWPASAAAPASPSSEGGLV